MDCSILFKLHLFISNMRMRYQLLFDSYWDRNFYFSKGVVDVLDCTQAQIIWKIGSYWYGNTKYLSINYVNPLFIYYLQVFKRINFARTIQKIFHFLVAKCFALSFRFADFVIFFELFRIPNWTHLKIEKLFVNLFFMCSHSHRFIF